MPSQHENCYVQDLIFMDVFRVFLIICIFHITCNYFIFLYYFMVFFLSYTLNVITSYSVGIRNVSIFELLSKLNIFLILNWIWQRLLYIEQGRFRVVVQQLTTLSLLLCSFRCWCCPVNDVDSGFYNTCCCYCHWCNVVPSLLLMSRYYHIYKSQIIDHQWDIR